MVFFRIAPMPTVASLGLLFAVVFTALFTAPDALARPEMTGQAVAERFAAIDTNKDGKISPEEFFAAFPNMKEAAFAAIDTDGDGFISLDEWLAFFKSHSREDSKAHSHGPQSTGGADCCPPEEQAKSGTGSVTEGNKNKIPALIMPPALKQPLSKP